MFVVKFGYANISQQLKSYLREAIYDMNFFDKVKFEVTITFK